MTVRHIELADFGRLDVVTTSGGDQVGVISGRLGRRFLVVYDRADPDATLATVELTEPDVAAVVHLLMPDAEDPDCQPRIVVVGSIGEALDEALYR